MVSLDLLSSTADPPGPASVVHASEYAVKGKSTTLSCAVEDPGLPSATHYRWEFEGALIATATGPTLETEPGSLTSRGKYSCAAVNDVGAGPSGDYELPVLGEPSVPSSSHRCTGRLPRI